MSQVINYREQAMIKPDITAVASLAGRELDAAVHRHLMGRECEWFFPTPGEFGSDLDGLYDAPLRSGQLPKLVPHYSTDFAALEVMIAAVRAKGWRVVICDNAGGPTRWFVRLEDFDTGRPTITGEGDTLHLAFARASLLTTYT